MNSHYPGLEGMERAWIVLGVPEAQPTFRYSGSIYRTNVLTVDSTEALLLRNKITSLMR